MARDGESRLTIGAVLRAVQDDFPDVSISKIRFLEAEGLLRPERTSSGYRSFSARDVERLRYILTAQRERFWPLKVIREALDAIDRGLEPTGPTGERPRVPDVVEDADVPTSASLAEVASDLRLTCREVVEAGGVDDATFDALCTYGLLKPGADGHFPASALPIARAAGALAGSGIEPRHLRPFRTAADRELALVQHVVSPARRRDPAAAAAAAAELLHHCLALHTALVKAGLQG